MTVDCNVGGPSPALSSLYPHTRILFWKRITVVMRMPQPIWFQFWTLGSADSLRAACCGSMVPNGLSITIFGIICWFLGVIIAVFVMSATHFSICSLCKCDLAPAGPCSCLAPLPMLSWLSGKFKIFPIHFKDSKIDIVFFNSQFVPLGKRTF